MELRQIVMLILSLVVIMINLTGYFIEPTVIVTSNPKYTTMCTELFGPVITIYVYEDDAFL